MPGANYTVFKQMRPPVAIDGAGQSPIRTKKASEVFSMGEGNFQDRQGFKVTKEQIVKNQTDDGRLVDIDWNNRHHVNPSFFNSTNKSYYQVSKPPIYLIIYYRNSSINLSAARRTLPQFQDANLTLTKKTMLKEPVYQNIQRFHSTETFSESWVGCPTSTSKSPKITMTDTITTASSSMLPKIMPSNSTQHLKLTQNFTRWTKTHKRVCQT